MDFYRNVDHFPICQDDEKASGISYDVIEELGDEAITPEFFHAHARIDFNTDDALIPTYITAARQELEAWTQRSFIAKQMRLTALEIPKDFKLMYGPVDSIQSPVGTEVFGDHLKEGGKRVVIDYTTRAVINDTIRVAIARYAAGLYAIREHILVNSKGDPVNGKDFQNEAKDMIKSYRNIIVFG